MTLPDAGKWNPERYKSPRHAKPAPGRPGRRSAPPCVCNGSSPACARTSPAAPWPCCNWRKTICARGRGRPDPGRAGPALRGAAASPAGRHPGASGRHLLPSRQHPARPVRWPDQRHGRRAPAGARLHGHQPACRGPALGRADAGRTGGRHLRRRGPVRIARADHAGGSGAAHHAAGGRDARAAPDAGPVRADGTPADNHEILGQSEPIARLLHEIDVVADSELPILLLGETGVGRNCSRTACRLSRRRAKPLVHVNCAALPESLAESELFGHAKSAFSGAVADRPGRFGPPTAAPCSWTKSANCRCWCRPSCCARCRTARSSAWATTVPGAWTCASWPPPTAA